MRKLLIVEDSRFFLDLICTRVREELKIPVEAVTNMADARELIADRGEEIFLALADLTLPDARGVEIVELLRGLGIPTIVFTG